LQVLPRLFLRQRFSLGELFGEVTEAWPPLTGRACTQGLFAGCTTLLATRPGKKAPGARVPLPLPSQSNSQDHRYPSPQSLPLSCRPARDDRLSEAGASTRYASATGSEPERPATRQPPRNCANYTGPASR
jgi:hypothetical protein